jgi:hypothetical protein
MSRKRRLQYLGAEAASVSSLLSILPEGSVIERDGLESRLVEIQQEIEASSAHNGQMAEAELVFYGAPVHGSEGIEARFAGTVLERYQDLVSKTMASRTIGGLSAAGPVPLERSSRLHITGTVQGSFGFEVQELSDQESFDDTPTPLFEAVEEAARLMVAAGDNDESFYDTVEGVNPRVYEALNAFLRTVYDGNAWFRLGTSRVDGEFTRERLQAAVDRAGATRQQREDVPVLGTFQGVLLGSRTFEHQAVNGDMYRGKAAPELDLAAMLIWSGRPCVAHVRVTTYTRPGGRETRRYTLLRIEASVP